MPYYERSTEGKLVPTTGEIPEEAVIFMERYDDEAIVKRMTSGIASSAFIYHYPIKTKDGVKEIIGISSDGADEIALMLGNIEVLNDARVDKDSDPDYIYGMVRAKDMVRNVTLLGVGRQCKFQIGKGNLPDHDRMDEHAFVKSITKAQRNVILHLAPEEVVVRIINTFDKSGRSAQLKPPKLEFQEETAVSTITPTPTPRTASPSATTVVKPPTAVTPEISPDMMQIAAQQEKLKQLRMQVHTRFQSELGIGVEQRKEMLSKKFGVDSLTALNEQQLNECNAWIEEIIQQKTVAPKTTAPAPSPKVAEVTPLGFDSPDEQKRLRGNLYTILTSANMLNLKDNEAKNFITDRGYTSSGEIPKNELVAMIKEANELLAAKQTPGEF